VELLRQRLLEKGIKLEVTAPARKLLASLSFDPVYGARPLKRTIRKRIADPLASLVVEGRLAEGGRVTVEASEREFEFNIDRERA
jgi:ATP-dependent Clp protease ATP-binding subunit ClpA